MKALPPAKFAVNNRELTSHIFIDLEVLYHDKYGMRPYAVPLLNALKNKDYKVVVWADKDINPLQKIVRATEMDGRITSYESKKHKETIGVDRHWTISSSEAEIQNDKGWVVSAWNGNSKDKELEQYVKHILGIS